MIMMKAKPKIDRVLEYFLLGKELTPQLIESRYKVSNGRDIIHKLRKRGYPVYRETRRTGGARRSFYRLGRPSRDIVAAGIRALGTSALVM